MGITLERSTLSILEDYIQEGQDITKSTQYGMHAGTKRQLEIGVPARYSSWKDDLQCFLRNHDFRDESGFFAEADSVPLIIGGLTYGDPRSQESLKLMESIRQETSRKLKILRKVRSELERKEADHKEKSVVGLKMSESQKAVPITDPTEGTPTLYVRGDKGKGYLSFSQTGNRIFVGRIKTRKYRLLELFSDQLGAQRSVESIFETIRLSKDPEQLSTEKQRSIIQNTIKEIQRVHELQGRLAFVWSPNNKKNLVLRIT